MYNLLIAICEKERGGRDREGGEKYARETRRGSGAGGG
jgi:hypothetical protein